MGKRCGIESVSVGSRENRNRDPLYTEFDISDELGRHRDVSRFIRSEPDDPDGPIAKLDDTIDEAIAVLTERYDTVHDYVPYHPVDWVSEDDLIHSSFPGRAMVKAYILKLVSPEISGFDSLQWTLERDDELAAEMGFEPGKIPHYSTFATQWWERYRHDFREHARFEAAKAALKCRQYGLEISEKAEELIDEFDRRDTGEDHDLPDKYRLENEERDRVFNEFRDLFNDLLDYDRGPNKQIPAEDLTELATFTSRRNESVIGGRDVYLKENQVTDSDYMCSEALAKPIRNFSRRLAELNYAKTNAVIPDKECYDWSVNPEDRDFGEGDSWHKRTESGIEEQVEMLKSRGMLDRPVDVCVDGVAREYNNRNDTNVEEPDGVLHRYPKYDTGYAYQDITLTAIYRGRAIVLANISKVKADNRFQCVRYLLDRARDLLNIKAVYADSEFATERICSYITHCGLDYVMKKRKQGDEIKEFLEEGAEGRADWKPYEVDGEGSRAHKTTLLALEKKSKAVTKKGEQRKKKEAEDEDEAQATFTDFERGEENVEDDADEEEEPEIERESFITSFDIEARGVNPNAVGPRREKHTAFGVGQLYRKRWSIETAFRDIKRNFKAKPRSRCLGVRRFFFMLCLLLYNCWVVLNLIVANEMDHRDDEEIIWRKKIFVIDLHNKVFPDVDFG